MRIGTIGLLAAAVLVPGWLAGCAQMSEQNMPAQAYSMPELISRTEQNSQGLTRFRSKGGRLAARIPTDKGMKRYDLDGVTVLYEQPKNLFLSGSLLGQPALQIGSNPETYWLGVMHDPSQMRWGYWKYVDRECNTWRMGGPVKLMEALGQVSLKKPEGNLSGPALGKGKGDHVLRYTAKGPGGRTFTAKEVYISPYETPTISRIVYYNPDGSEEMSIRYSDYRTVGNALMANKIELNWPARQSYLRLTLNRVTPEASLPEEAFHRPDPSTFNEVEQVDKNCQ
jgi:hypothetical protein